MFAKMLNAFLSDSSIGEANNFDMSERMEMLKEYGAMVISLTGKEHRESMLGKLVKTGIFASIQPCSHNTESSPERLLRRTKTGRFSPTRRFANRHNTL